MKKALSFLSVLILCVFFGSSACAAARFSNAGELYGHWLESWLDFETSPYPDYVCGVWSTYGDGDHLTIAVTADEAGEAGKEEILGLIADKDSVTFAYQNYSYAELWAIQQELAPRLGEETGACAIGVYDMENRVGILIDTANENSEAFINECLEKYGDKIVFEGGDGIRILATDSFNGGFDVSVGVGIGAGTAARPPLWPWLICAAALLFALMFGLLRHRRTLAVQTVNGDVIACSGRLSTRQVERAVREDLLCPPVELDCRILDKI